MELLIKKIDDFSLPRIVQLTQRTNQFNLTTKRYLEKDIKNFSSCAYTEIFSAQLKDRFGDYGIIGAAILRYGELDAVIDTFLLSCRVIGRGIEEVLLKFCVEAAIKRECKNLTGIYVPTKNNSLVKDFYCTHKFSYMGNNGDGLKFIFHLGKDNLEFPSYFKSIITPDLGVR
jgi:FkbH-like protein